MPQKPKIKICLSGLGILCLNEKAGGEIGYLLIDNHDVKISIWKNCVPVITNETMNGKNLGIFSDAIGNCEFYTEPGNAANYESMIDLKEIYGPTADLKPTNQYQSKVFIHDSVFFTEPDSIINVEQFAEDLSVPPERKNVGTGLWGHSKSEEAYFIYNGVTYKPGSNEVYTIRIYSDCGVDFEYDFKYFYDYLQNAGPTRFNLRDPTANQWMIDCELSDFEALVDNLHKVRERINVRPGGEDVGEVRDDRGLRMELKTRINWLINILCAPEPCLKVTFLDKPRSLS